jgi:hypothetical protein
MILHLFADVNGKNGEKTLKRYPKWTKGDVKKGRTAKKRKNIESTMVSISVT